MRRFIISAVLLFLCLALCTASCFFITKQAQAILGQLSPASELLLNDNINQACKALEECEKTWNKKKIVFLVFLDHESFSELENTIPTLNLLLQFDKNIVADKILRCCAVLEDLIEHQKVSIGNIL